METRIIPNYSQYSINEDGSLITRIRINSSKKIQKASIKASIQLIKGKESGYLYVSLLAKDVARKDNSIYDQPGLFRISVHRLVAFAWHGLPTKERPWVNHKDGNKMNNHYTNLEWSSISENIQHAHDTGLKITPKGANHPRFGSKMSYSARKKMSDAKEGKKHPRYTGCFYIRGRKYYSANSAAKDLQINPMTILRRCKKGDNKDYVFVPDPDKTL